MHCLLGDTRHRLSSRHLRTQEKQDTAEAARPVPPARTGYLIFIGCNAAGRALNISFFESCVRCSRRGGFLPFENHRMHIRIVDVVSKADVLVVLRQCDNAIVDADSRCATAQPCTLNELDVRLVTYGHLRSP